MPQINLMELAEQSFWHLARAARRPSHFTSCWSKLVQERSAACPLNNRKKSSITFPPNFDRQAAHQQTIDLGIYDEVKDQLTAAGHDLNKDRGIRGRAVARQRWPGSPGRVLPGFHRHAGLDRRWRGPQLSLRSVPVSALSTTSRRLSPTSGSVSRTSLVDDGRSYTVEFGGFCRYL